jgi:hypothetical protein
MAAPVLEIMDTTLYVVVARLFMLFQLSSLNKPKVSLYTVSHREHMGCGAMQYGRTYYTGCLKVEELGRQTKSKE